MKCGSMLLGSPPLPRLSTIGAALATAQAPANATAATNAITARRMIRTPYPTQPPCGSTQSQRVRLKSLILVIQPLT